MRFLFVIAAIFVLARITCLVQLSFFTDPDAVAMYYDNESGEEKKSDTESYEKKFDKHLQHAEYTVYLDSYILHRKSNTATGLCMKSHCPLLDQPPESC